jgi:hypothetical protein
VFGYALFMLHCIFHPSELSLGWMDFYLTCIARYINLQLSIHHRPEVINFKTGKDIKQESVL